LILRKSRQLPEGWRWVSLGDVSTKISKGTTPTTLGRDFVSSGIPFLRAEDILGGAADWSKVAFYISYQTHDFLYRSKLQPGDLLITIAGTLGRVGYIPNNSPPLNCNQAVAFVRLKPNVDSRYVCFACQSTAFYSSLVGLKATSTISNLNLKQIKEAKIPLPPTLDGQIAIASELERKMAEVDKMRRAALRQEEAIAAMQRAILREVFPYKEGEKLPEGWRWEKLGGKKGIAEIINGATPSTDNPEYWDGDILWATPADLGKLNLIYIDNTERKITTIGLDNCYTTLLPVGTVLLTSRAPVGNLAIAQKPICTNQGFKSFIPNKGINSLYLYFAIKNIVPEIQKQSHGNTFTEITKELVRNFEIPLPPTLDDQIAIASELERKMAEVNKIRQATDRQLEAIEALPGAILREVFNFVN